MNNDIKLDRQHNQKGGTNESIVQWNINGLRNNFEQLTNADGRAGPHDSMPTSMYDSMSSPKQFTRHVVAILVKEGIISFRFVSQFFRFVGPLIFFFVSFCFVFKNISFRFVSEKISIFIFVSLTFFI
jgi:hypothetical protein